MFSILVELQITSYSDVLLNDDALVLHCQDNNERSLWKSGFNVNKAVYCRWLRIYCLLFLLQRVADRRKEGNVLFNDALNTLYLRLYGRKERNVLFNDALKTLYLRLCGRKEGNVLFNDALNTFYLRLYGVRHMVKDHSDSEKGNPLPPHRLLLTINSKGSFICTIPHTG